MIHKIHENWLKIFNVFFRQSAIDNDVMMADESSGFDSYDPYDRVTPMSDNRGSCGGKTHYPVLPNHFS